MGATRNVAHKTTILQSKAITLNQIIIGAETGVRIQSFEDVGDLIGSCFGAAGILLTESELSPAFFDLKTGLAGDFLQKVTNYKLRTAIVLRNAAAYGPRFAELALDTEPVELSVSSIITQMRTHGSSKSEREIVRSRAHFA